MEDLTTKIDLYLSGNMTMEDRLAFELALENDAELRAEVELQKKTQALLERGAYIDLKEKVGALNQGYTPVRKLKIIGRVAAVLLIALIPGYFYIQSRFADSHLYASYAEPYPDRITNMSGSLDAQISAAMELYNNHKYADALVIFDEVRRTDPDNTEITLYEAVSLMNTDQHKAAIQLLEGELERQPINSTAYEWQLILAYLGNNEGEKAIPLLKKFLSHNNGYQQENAIALLEDLESFWR